MICRKCGANVKSDFKFCPYCGERIISDFHGQYEELSPPYVVRGPEQTGSTAEFYVEEPDEEAPDFELPARPAGGRFDIKLDDLREDLEDDFTQDEGVAPAPLIEEEDPLEPPRRYSGARSQGYTGRFDTYIPLIEQDEPFAQTDYNGFDRAASAEDAPYIVFQPENSKEAYRSGENPFQRPDPFTAGRGKEQEPAPAKRPVRKQEPAQVRRTGNTGPGIGWRLLLICLILLAAGAVSFFGYRMLHQPEPFVNADETALFTSASSGEDAASPA